MSTQKLSLENFEEIYNSTYNKTLHYIICKCSNIDDVNDILQNTYIDLYNMLIKKEYIELENCQSYIIGIAKRKVQKHYGLLHKFLIHPIFQNYDEEDYELEILSDVDLETDLITKLDAEEVWKYIKSKNMLIIKVFYLYYYSELKISQIAKELEISESNVKNILYRTIKDIKKNVKIEGDINV